MQQLQADINGALEQGESWDDIEKNLASPEDVAAEFNETFGVNWESNGKKV